MLSCKKATELIEKKDLAGLDPIQNLQLSLHLMMCKACKDYEKQSTLLDNMVSLQMKRNTKSAIEQKKETIELKGRIITLICEKDKKADKDNG